MGTSWQEKARAFIKAGQEGKALRLVEERMEIHPTEKKEQIELQIFRVIAETYRDENDTKKAIEYFTKTFDKLDSIQELSETLWEALVLDLYDLAELFKMEGHYGEAIECYQELIEIHENSGVRSGLIDDYGDLGHLHYELKAYPEANRYYALAIRVARELNDYYRESLLRFHQGLTLFQMGSFLAAADQFKQYLEGVRRIKAENPLAKSEDFDLFGRAKKLLGESVKGRLRNGKLELEVGEYSLLKRHFTRILEILEGENLPLLESEVYLLRAEISLNEGELSRAKEHLHRGIKALKRAKNYKKSTIFKEIQELLKRMRESGE